MKYLTAIGSKYSYFADGQNWSKYSYFGTNVATNFVMNEVHEKCSWALSDATMRYAHEHFVWFSRISSKDWGNHRFWLYTKKEGFDATFLQSFILLLTEGFRWKRKLFCCFQVKRAVLTGLGSTFFLRYLELPRMRFKEVTAKNKFSLKIKAFLLFLR